MEDIAISIKNISKSFKISHDRSTSLKQTALNSFKRKKYSKFTSVSSLNLEIKKGEFFGIVGRNGCGKSTLLKMIAGIYVPNKGMISVNGSLAPFIELGVGFNPELTGRENVYLSGAILGMKRQEIDGEFNNIVSFAEIEEFIDQKLKNYSSGMQVRLAFSIAVQARSDIMLIDEVLAVGDAAFQTKCLRYFHELKASGKTIVFVSHDMTAVSEFCDRVLVLDEGKEVITTNADEATRIYGDLNIEKSMKEIKRSIKTGRWGSGDALIDKVEIINSSGPTDTLVTGDKFSIRIHTKSVNSGYSSKIKMAIGFNSSEGLHIAAPKIDKGSYYPGDTIEFSMPRRPLLEGRYTLTVALSDQENNEVLDFLDNHFAINVLSKIKYTGKVEFNGTWKNLGGR